MIYFHTHLCLKLQVITSFTPRAGMQRTTIPRALDLEIKGCTIFKYFTTPACAKWKSRNKVDRDVLIWHEAPEKQKWFIIRTTLRALLGSTWQNNLSKRKGHQETLYFCSTQFYLLLFLPFFQDLLFCWCDWTVRHTPNLETDISVPAAAVSSYFLITAMIRIFLNKCLQLWTHGQISDITVFSCPGVWCLPFLSLMFGSCAEQARHRRYMAFVCTAVDSLIENKQTWRGLVTVAEQAETSSSGAKSIPWQLYLLINEFDTQLFIFWHQPLTSSVRELLSIQIRLFESTRMTVLADPVLLIPRALYHSCPFVSHVCNVVM